MKRHRVNRFINATVFQYIKQFQSQFTIIHPNESFDVNNLCQTYNAKKYKAIFHLNYKYIKSELPVVQ